jgi:hypothetical protein
MNNPGMNPDSRLLTQSSLAAGEAQGGGVPEASEKSPFDEVSVPPIDSLETVGAEHDREALKLAAELTAKKQREEHGLFKLENGIEIMRDIGVKIPLKAGQSRMDLIRAVADRFPDRIPFDEQFLEQIANRLPGLNVELKEDTVLGVAFAVNQYSRKDWDETFDYLEERNLQMARDADVITACILAFGASGELMYNTHALRGFEGGLLSWPGGRMSYRGGGHHLSDPQISTCPYLNDGKPADADTSYCAGDN